jgi:hypothetical protein
MSLTEHVDPAIALIEQRLQAAEAAYLGSHAYFNQLTPADACLGSFLAHELDPAASRSVGGASQSLAALLGADDEFTTPLRRAVATVVTAGYLTMLTTEDPPGSDWVRDRDPESLWRFWASHLKPSSIPALGIPDRLADLVGRDGGRYLEAEIARLGLRPGLLRRRVVSQRCSELARSGLVLRVGQTAHCSDAEFARTRLERAELPVA